MQTIENPSEQPEHEYPDLKPLPERINLIFGSLGWSIIMWMFEHPFEGYLPPDMCDRGSHPATQSWYPIMIARGWALGIFTLNATNTGYTLTSNGRLYVAEQLEHVKRRRERSSFYWSNYTPDEMAMMDEGVEGAEPRPFDLLDF